MQVPGFISTKPGPEGRFPINLYLTMETETSRPALRRVPGLVHRVTPYANLPVRGLHNYSGMLVAIVGNKLYKITGLWVATELGTLNTSSGPVWIEDDRTYLVIVDGKNGYYYNKAAAVPALTVIGGAFPVPSSLCYQDRYWIASRLGRDTFQISAIGNPTSWDALDEGIASGRSDKLVGSLTNGRVLWLFGENTVDCFANTGNADFPFERIQGSAQEIGVSAAAAMCVQDRSVFWLDNLGRVVKNAGFGHTVVSTPELERKIAGYTRSDAIMWAMVWQGHPWVILTFPSNSTTWAYDAATQSWFQWASKKYEDDLLGRWRANCYAECYGYHVVGDYETGKVYTLDQGTDTDGGEPIRWERTAPPMENDGKKLFFPQFELQAVAGKNSGARAILDWSDDDGQTWSSERFLSLGQTGEYKARPRAFGLGASRKRTWRVSGTDRVTDIYGALVDNASAGAH